MNNSTVVVIGASAGGLQVLEELVSLLPANKGYIYIIAQHLNPNRKSSLSVILSSKTKMSVSNIDENCTFFSNHIYILPANFAVKNIGHSIKFYKTYKKEHIPTPSIDNLFESMAIYKKEKCIAVVLTGSGDDGSKGICIVKEHKGTTIAQSLEEAKYKSMPQSAIGTGCVDYILDIKHIAKTLQSNSIMKKNGKMENEEEREQVLKKIRQLLIKREKLNIEKYKDETILRRINKRMILVRSKTFNEYLSYIKSNPIELHLLYQNILIGVTSFFRDTKAFEVLKKELLKYIDKKTENYDLRIWSIACSTGEEAYSLAILIDMIIKELHKKINVHIFATDIDEDALKKARLAIYSKESLKNIDKNIIDNYFVECENGYRVVENIRKQIVFTYHNILSDPPFINQDMISCRNLLIYILPEAQEEIFTLFHYAIKENGLLFLGSSESILLSMKYFVAIDGEYKIYVKEKLKNPPKISSHYFTKHLEEKNFTDPKNMKKIQDFNIKEKISDAIFNFFSPNCIVIDKDFSIIYKRGDFPFMKMPDGFVTLNLLDNIDISLKYDLRRLLVDVFSNKKVQATKFIEVEIDNGRKIFVRVIAFPHKVISFNSMVILYFQQLNAEDLQFSTNSLTLPNESFVIKNLTTRLSQAQEENYALLDELMMTKENMQLLNEELQSSNEELQSSNEELETSNEELQTSNEELHASIRAKQELQKQLLMILNSTQDGIVGLDIKGNQTFINDAALNMLGFSREEMIGKNAHKLWHHSRADGSYYAFEDCTLHNYLENKKSIRTQDVFWKKDGTPMEVEILQNPIIENDKAIGAVLSFHDITSENRLKKEIEHEHCLAELYINTIDTIVMMLDIDGKIKMINNKGCQILGRKREKLIGVDFVKNFVFKEDQQKIQDIFNSVINEQAIMVSHIACSIKTANKNKYFVSWTTNSIKDLDGNIVGIITSGMDLTKEKKLCKKLFEQEHIYKLTFEEADIGIAHVSLEGKWIDTNEYLSKILGYTKEEFKKLSVSDITYKDDIDDDKVLKKELLEEHKNSYHIEKRYIHKNGDIVWVNLSVVVLKDEAGSPLYFLKIIRDISQLKLLMYQIKAEKDKFKKIIAFAPIPLILYEEEGKVILTNKVFEKTTGYSCSELPNIDILIGKLYKNLDKTGLEAIKKYYKNPTLLKSNKQEFVTKTGEKRVGIFNSVVLYDTNNDKKNSYLIAIMDITEMQNKDKLMIAQSRQAAMGDMLAMIAHQWRQPLSVISMVSNNIRAEMELGEQITTESLEELMTTLNRQVKYLSGTIDDFRDFFKPDKKREKIKISAVLQKVVSLVEKSLENNAIKLKISKHTDIEISTYINQLIQILINLINNAKDALKENKNEKGVITIDAKIKNNKVVISVCDNAGGISPKVKDKIGQPYVTTKSQNGTGLGLYMSIIIATKYLNGDLYWDSSSKGSCFYVALPYNPLIEKSIGDDI